MSADTLLSRLAGVRKMGAGRWHALCPAHPDKRPSLSIRELDDGRILLHDFSGCSVEDVLGAVGLEFDALYPERAIDHRCPPERKPFNAADILAAVGFEALVVSIAASTLERGEVLGKADRERLQVANKRLQEAAGVANG